MAHALAQEISDWLEDSQGFEVYLDNYDESDPNLVTLWIYHSDDFPGRAIAHLDIMNEEWTLKVVFEEDANDMAMLMDAIIEEFGIEVRMVVKNPTVDENDPRFEDAPPGYTNMQSVAIIAGLIFVIICVVLLFTTPGIHIPLPQNVP